MGSSAIAEQGCGTSGCGVAFRNIDPVAGTIKSTDPTGVYNTADRIGLEPLGAMIPPEDEEVHTPNYNEHGYGFTGNPEKACFIDNGLMDCGVVNRLLMSAGLIGPGGMVLHERTWRLTLYRLYDNENIDGNDRANAGENWQMFGRSLGIQEGEPWYETSFDLIGLPGDLGSLSEQRRLSRSELRGIRGQLAGTLRGNKQCNDFLKETLKKLDAGYKDILAVFDAYAAKRRVYDDPGTTGRTPFPARSRRARLEIDLNDKEFVLTMFHELLHGAGWRESFSHTDIGGAMYETALVLGLMPKREFFEGDPEKLSSKDSNIADNEKNRVEGQYYRAGEVALKAACGKK